MAIVKIEAGENVVPVTCFLNSNKIGYVRSGSAFIIDTYNRDTIAYLTHCPVVDPTEHDVISYMEHTK